MWPEWKDKTERFYIDSLMNALEVIDFILYHSDVDVDHKAIFIFVKRVDGVVLYRRIAPIG